MQLVQDVACAGVVVAAVVAVEDGAAVGVQRKVELAATAGLFADDDRQRLFAVGEAVEGEEAYLQVGDFVLCGGDEGLRREQRAFVDGVVFGDGRRRGERLQQG